MSRPLPRLITIDGPPGAGKTTLANGLAEAFAYRILETGYAYRAAALLLAEDGVPPDNLGVLNTMTLQPGAADARTTVLLADGRRLSETDLRTPEIDAAVTQVAARPEIRRELTALCRAVMAEHPTIVLGRDAGTAIAPHAEVKFFLTAAPAVLDDRLRRQRPSSPTLDPANRRLEEAASLAARLSPAPDAIEVDTTLLTVGEVRVLASSILSGGIS